MEVVVSSRHSLNVISRDLDFILRLTFPPNVFRDTDVIFFTFERVAWVFWFLKQFRKHWILYSLQLVEYS